MNIDFTGRLAVICGGSRGIGRAVALGFAAAGADVSICARGAETLEQTRAEIAARGHQAHAAPVTEAMLALYTGPLNWRPDQVYHLSNDAVFESWDWGHGLGRPESLSALQAARSVDPHLRVMVAHGLFDLRTPYFGSARLLGMLPHLDGAAPVVLRVYPGGHMFYFDDAARAALHDDARTVFDPSRPLEDMQ